MYLLAAEKTEIINALEKEYRRCIRQLFEGNNTPGEEAQLRDRIQTMKHAMEKIESLNKRR